MFNRVRSYEHQAPEFGPYSDSTRYRYNTNGGPCPVLPDSVVIDARDKLRLAEYGKGTISDLVLPRPDYFRGRVPINRRVPRLVKPVSHDRKKIVDINKDATLFSGNKDIGSVCMDNYARNILSTPLGFMSQYIGIESVVSDCIDAIPNTVAGHSFTGVDWFSMVSEFNEGLDSLIPSTFFVGETAMEGSIFADAIRLVVSPKKVVRGLIKNAKRRRLQKLPTWAVFNHYKRILLSSKRKKVRTYELEQLADDMGIPLVGIKDVINADLLYKFGVQPAIHDVGLAVEAHSKVSERLSFLNRNRGQYVPIRVRRLSGDTAETFPVYSSPYAGFMSGLTRSKRVNVLFGHGKVRTDINDASKYRAYAEYFGLNKVVGTAWEMIPFSFVVDWFTNAQERLDELTRFRLGEGPFVNLTALGHSIKDVLAYEVKYFPGYSNAFGVNLSSPEEPVRCFTVEVSHYERYSGFPETSGVVDMSNLGLFHGITSGELLIQKFL